MNEEISFILTFLTFFNVHRFRYGIHVKIIIKERHTKLAKKMFKFKFYALFNGFIFELMVTVMSDARVSIIIFFLVDLNSRHLQYHRLS